MKSKYSLGALAALLTLAGVPAFGGDAPPADSAERAKETKAKIEAAREESAKIRQQVTVTLEALNRMRTSGVDLRAQFQTYANELAKMEDQAKLARDRAASMGEKGQAYFSAWEDSINSMTNPDIKKQAKERYNKRLKSYNKIVKEMGEARDELKPFMSDLNDIKKMLDSELSAESVKSAKNLMKQASWNGGDVIESLKDVEKEFDRVAAELAKYE